MTVKKKPAPLAKPAAQQRENWLRALSTADDPGHVMPTLVLYRLLKLSNLITRPFIEKESERYKISLNEVRVLTTLAPLREAASHEVAHVAGMNQMSVSRAVAALRANKRIRQHADPNNRRRKLLQLTPAGWTLHREILQQVGEVADKVFRDLTPIEIGQLSRLIDMMMARLENAEVP